MSAAAPLPSRACASWCENGGRGHFDLHPEDRSCWGPIHELTVTQRLPVEVGFGDLAVDSIDVVLRRRPGQCTEPRVLINNETDGSELELTLDEAQELAQILAELLGEGRAG